MKASEQPKARNRELYQRLYAAKHDLNQAEFFANHVLKKGWHFEPWERQWATYMHQSAYTTALVIAYSRPFTETHSWPKLPKKVTPYDAEQSALHKRLLALRNEVYAHTDVGSFNIRPFKIGDDASAIEMLPRMRLARHDLTLLLRMIALTKVTIEERLRSLIDLVTDET